MKDYPFQLDNIFFIEIKAKRIPDLSSSISVNGQVKVSQNPESQDQTQVNLIIKTEEKSSLELSLELVAIFKHREQHAQEPLAIYRFLQDRGMFILWSYMAQMIKLITSQMEMKGFNIGMPEEFGLEELKKAMNIEG